MVAYPLAPPLGLGVPHEPRRRAGWTPDRPPEVRSTAFAARLPDLHLRPLMDTDFAISCPLVRPQVPLSGFCTSGRGFAPRFLQTPPRDGALAFLLILHLHQVG